MEALTPAEVAKLQGAYDAAQERVLAVNADLPERVRTADLMAYYDPDDDVAIVTLGPPGDCVMLELADNVWLRLEPDTDCVIGFEFMAASTLDAGVPSVDAMLRIIIEEGSRAPGTWVPFHVPTGTDLAAGVRELVPA